VELLDSEGLVSIRGFLPSFYTSLANSQTDLSDLANNQSSMLQPNNQSIGRPQIGLFDYCQAWFLVPFPTEIFGSSNCYLPEGNEAIDCEDVVGRGSEQYLLGKLSTIA
jgi:hypothetical protein